MNIESVIDGLIHSGVEPVEGFKFIKYFYGDETRDKIKVSVAERVLNTVDLREVGMSQSNAKFCRYADSMLNHHKVR